jgi:undecaprenyl-diphosphatase
MQGIDERIVLFFQSIRWAPLTKLLSIFIPLEFWYVAAFALVLFFLFRTGTLRVPVVSFVLAKSLSNFCYETVKDLVHRPRPFLTIKGLVPVIIPHGFSFPSGHATLAMAMAVVLAFHFPKARSLVYTLAVLIGFSRVYFGVHYLSDVLAGFVLGTVVGCLCILLERAIFSLAKGVDLRKQFSRS